MAIPAIPTAMLALGFAMNIAAADISMAQADCMNVNYTQVATHFEGKMKDATRLGDTTAYREASAGRQMASDMAQACAVFVRAHQSSIGRAQ